MVFSLNSTPSKILPCIYLLMFPFQCKLPLWECGSGKYYTCDYHLKQDLDNRLKETRNGFTYMLGRIDVDQSWPYRTLFSYKRDGDLCFIRLNIPDDQVRIYDIKNSVLLEEVFQDYSILDEMMNKLKVVLQDFVDKNPKVNSIVFYSPLCF